MLNWTPSKFLTINLGKKPVEKLKAKPQTSGKLFSNHLFIFKA
jgi:hypothetical protein